MSLFELYFKLGLQHIADLKGYDRILFIFTLFSFNMGIEAGQILIVAVIILLTKVVVDFLHLPRREWHLVLSGAGLGISLVLMVERFPL